jgi:hypothetical protein
MGLQAQILQMVLSIRQDFGEALGQIRSILNPILKQEAT